MLILNKQLEKIYQGDLPWSKYQMIWFVVSTTSFPKKELINVLAGLLRYPYSSHSSFVMGPTSSIDTIAFLKMGGNWAKWALKWSGTVISHSTNPKNFFDRIPATKFEGVIRRWLRGRTCGNLQIINSAALLVILITPLITPINPATLICR